MGWGLLLQGGLWLLKWIMPSKAEKYYAEKVKRKAAEREVEHGKDRIKIDDEVSQLDADALADELRKHNRRR